MDISIFVMLWIIFIVVQNVADKKKPRQLPPPDSTNSPDFEIPTLANDPTAEIRDIDLFEVYQQKKSETQEISEPVKKIEKVEEKKLPLGINPDSAMNAIIMSEILSKPKALRKK